MIVFGQEREAWQVEQDEKYKPGGVGGGRRRMGNVENRNNRVVKGGRVKMPGWASSHAESALAQGDSNSPLHGRRASPAKEPLDPGYCVHIRDTYAADLSILQANGAPDLSIPTR